MDVRVWVWKSSGPECAPPPLVPLVPFSSAHAEALIGEYDFVLVADAGPRGGHSAHGKIHLSAVDTLRRYYTNSSAKVGAGVAIGR